MTPALQLVLALFFDILCGDPPWLPHPVNAIARLAAAAENLSRRCLYNQYLAGIVTVVLVCSLTVLAVSGLIMVAGRMHPAAGVLLTIYFLYAAMALRDLTRHSRAVYDALARENIAEARKRVGMLVGRDTEHLGPEEIARACVESVAENMVDGVMAPLFYATLGGPAAALLYKAINTMDSLFGYRNERYCQFGWAAARLDDVANFVPARLTALLVPLAALLLGLDAGGAVRVFWRDRGRHASPNSGQVEAAAAGALGVRLGGRNMYQGVIRDSPVIGAGGNTVQARDILRANQLLWTVTGLALPCVLFAAG